MRIRIHFELKLCNPYTAQKPLKIDLKLYECSLVFYTAPRNKTDELNPSPYHCNISASYFTFSFRNCQLFVCRHSNSSTSFRFLLAAKLWLGHTRETERKREREAGIYVKTTLLWSFLCDTKPLCRNPHF